MKEVILGTKICKHIYKHYKSSKELMVSSQIVHGQVCAVHDSKTANPEVTHVSRIALN